MAREYPAFFTHREHQKSERKKDHKLLECDTCHKTDSRGPLALPLKGIQSEGTFNKIKADTFRTIPGGREADAHASCAKCHWQENKPTLNDCSGCHLTRSDYTAKTSGVFQPPALSPNAARWFKDWPKGVPMRRSLKFPHDTHTRSADGTESNGHDIGCATCHVNIVQLTPQNPSKPDVEIIACAACHAPPGEDRIRVGQDSVLISDEMTWKKDPSKNYTCVACHTAIIGSEQPPCSHYTALEQPCPNIGQQGKE
jgi:predicted metal-binding protein